MFARQFLAALAVAVTAFSGSAHARCADKDAVWEASGDGVRHTLSITEDAQRLMVSIARIEEWRGPKLAWRLEADIGCSNGAVTCRLGVPNMLHPDKSEKDEGDYSTAVVERIDGDGDGGSEWIVFAGLEQELYYAGGAQVEFLNGFGREDPNERIVVPNIFRFSSCRAGAASPGPAPDLDEQISGFVYGIPSLCDAYNSQGSLDLDPDEGLWWMDDRRLVGLEFECTIVRPPSQTIDLSCGAEGMEWNETRQYREEGDVRYVDGLELRRCRN